MKNKIKIKNTVKSKKVLKGIDIFNLDPKDISLLSSLIINECKNIVTTEFKYKYNYCWMSRSSMVKNNVIREFKSLPKLQKITDRIIEKLKSNFPIEIRHTINRGPCYTWYTAKKNQYKGDWVCVPEPDRFISSKYYYKTLLHELAHAACSRTRLCLKLKEEEEEISVELVSLIICILSGYNVWDNCLGYVTNWSYDSERNKNTLKVKSNTQWIGIERKTKRIVNYLIYGKDGK